MAANPDKPRRKPRHRKSRRDQATNGQSSAATASTSDEAGSLAVRAHEWPGFADVLAERPGTTETRLVIDQLRARADGTIGGRHRPASN